MKTLKFDHQWAQQILEGAKTSTWRFFDDKDLSVGDQLRVIDKIEANDPKSWRVLGTGVVTEVIEKRLRDATATERLAQSLKSPAEALAKYQAYYGPRVTADTPFKIVLFNFVPSPESTPSAAMLLEEAKLYTDGGSRGNPGDSACAFVICKMDDSVVEKSGYYMGLATNNQAEYYGFKLGLERARDLGISRVSLFSDSQLVVNQMNGVYKVKNQELAPLHQEVKEVEISFESVIFNYIPRELNKLADGEVNRILDEQNHLKPKKRR